jgi:hypothetical protein
MDPGERRRSWRLRQSRAVRGRRSAGVGADCNDYLQSFEAALRGQMAGSSFTQTNPNCRGTVARNPSLVWVTLPSPPSTLMR